MQKQQLLIGFIVVLVGLAIAFLYFSPPKLGLDLQGGSQLTIKVQPTAERTTITKDDLEAVKQVIEKRINGLGVSEAIVQETDNNKIIVQLPGVTNPEKAERVLGGTAQLEFRQQRGETEPQFVTELTVRDTLKAELEDTLTQLKQKKDDPALTQKVSELQGAIQESNEKILSLFDSVGLTGKQLKNAAPEATTSGNLWNVALGFDTDGGDKFAQLTKEIAGTNRSIGIFLDNELISSPIVPEKFKTTGITGGGAIIEGNFTLESARELAIKIKGGSLPFPVKVEEIRTVGATLGQDSIRSSIIAGVSGLLLVLIFMGIYYRLPGLIADIALLIYAPLTLAVFALVGVTLTLPGIAGFILSIGMAVDANVLIFERTREELRAGKTLYRAVESGFERAFSSILDSNVTTLIACGALFWLGSGLVKGFALTLAIGVGVSMFTALTCSRTFLLFTVLGFPSVRQKPELFCPNLPESAKS